MSRSFQCAKAPTWKFRNSEGENRSFADSCFDLIRFEPPTQYTALKYYADYKIDANSHTFFTMIYARRYVLVSRRSEEWPSSLVLRVHTRCTTLHYQGVVPLGGAPFPGVKVLRFFLGDTLWRVSKRAPCSTGLLFITAPPLLWGRREPAPPEGAGGVGSLSPPSVPYS